MSPDGPKRPARKEREDCDYAVEADFGLRPRRAAGWPGIDPAHSSQRSACLPIRRASEYVTRRTAPLDSSTSLLQLSHTRMVLRAMNEILAKIHGANTRSEIS